MSNNPVALPAPRIRALGDAAASVVFGATIAPDVHARARAFCAALAAARIEGVEEWAPAFASATVWYDPDTILFAELAERLAALARAPASAAPAGALFEIPFCAEGDFAPDLEEIARLKGLTAQGWLDAFGGLALEVYMLGFQPGFAYLGVLPEQLSAPRLQTPRPKVPAGALAIADSMCAAYPFASPGGWRLIGRTPALLFDVSNAARPALLAPGDRVRWRAVSRAEFDALDSRWRAENLRADELRAAP
ncbi:5-oxoprolinase subunit PxpB [Rhodoblastus acidophilus]|uniref:5-oxoprolinase subunit PxpB n=1 Tax=Candidatus Rhodoblastus alkanivorans TaxID=2954117 RepID=A0ABS9Z8A8_9HYPH|nr:5-oxoprolinase subunit PxpB [Candidatus Rhodoblastus alkanivorans]MCI4677959.1 5-oxoprolinase subunit PxpB [Candidatus Rhodoblastus alkanivorans]MCI4683854.1 5-oxoprolinase subunit PxpB [Candidatus Rhodoblastus alkanivorans]MDI4641172.1 5-oxoprolinase subunit PxpB [Rhodoblastus acidophilus]